MSSFGFFFPGVRGGGERMQWTPEDLEEGKAWISRLCQAIRAGVFLPTTDHKRDCTYCDYCGSVCGDVEKLAAASQEKLANHAEAALDPLRKLRPPKDGKKGK